MVTLMKEAPGSSETSVLARATRHNNPEDTILLIKLFAFSNITKQRSYKAWARGNFLKFSLYFKNSVTCLTGGRRY
jgi:hypothetical protein